MLPTMRRSMIVTSGAFVFFGVAYLCLMRIADPRAPLDAAANAHLNIRLAFVAINWSAQITFLLVVFGGLPFLLVAVKQAITRKRGNLLALFTIRPKALLRLVACTIVLEVSFFAFLALAQAIAGGQLKSPQPIILLSPLELVAQLSVVTLFTFVIVTITVLTSQAILHSEFSTRMLQYALLLMGLTVLAMSITFLAIVAWILGMWISAPQIADSLGLGPAGLRGEIGGSEGVVIVVAMMILAATLTAFAFRRGWRAYTLTLA